MTKALCCTAFTIDHAPDRVRPLPVRPLPVRPLCPRAGMSAYAQLQEGEFAAAPQGYGAVTHQKFVGTGYFDLLSNVISENTSSVTALKGSTEEEQFHH